MYLLIILIYLLIILIIFINYTYYIYILQLICGNDMSTRVHIAMSETRKRTLILGAGFSGIVSLKSALEADLGDVVCYEQSYCIGGLWKYRKVIVYIYIYKCN